MEQTHAERVIELKAELAEDKKKGKRGKKK